MEVKKALVFSGGGGKGAYQIGAWKALREIGFEPDIVTGTSVGALNGVLVALNKYDEALDIWENMTMQRVFTQYLNAENTQNLIKDGDLTLLAKDVLINRGADIKPLEELVYGMMDEEYLRNSKIKFGLVTTQFPMLKAVKLFIDDIPEGTAADYVLASAAIFPLFKTKKIGDSIYVDGGYTENMPIQMAVEAGANEIVVVDISDLHQPLTDNDANIYYIHSKRPFNAGQFGTVLMFDKELSNQYMEQGYLDTLKEFNMLDGYYYSFKKGEKFNTGEYESLCRYKFKRIFSCLPGAGRFEKMGREKIIDHLCNYDENPFEHYSNVLLSAEMAAEIFEINPRIIYTLEQISELIIDEYKQVPNLFNGFQFNKLFEDRINIENIKQMIGNIDIKSLVVYATEILLSDIIDERQKTIIWILARLRPEAICSAIFCYSAIKLKELRNQ